VFYVLLVSLMTRNPVLRSAAIVLAGLIGLSRIYLGVHYPTDVLAGYAAAIVWLAACQLLRKTFAL
jgi:undecaprenyl-diphosphatase